MANIYGDTPPGVVPTAPAQTSMGQVNQNPFGSGGGPIQYFIANGGNPVMAANFAQWMSAAPPELAQQFAQNPKMAFQMYTQGTGYDPSSRGLTANSQGQYVDSSGAVYNSQKDPAQQATNAGVNQQWQTMYMNSPMYNRGGQLSVPQTASNPAGIAPSVSNNLGNVSLTNPPPPAPTTQTTPGQVSNGQIPNPQQQGGPTNMTPQTSVPTVTDAQAKISIAGTPQYTQQPQVQSNAQTSQGSGNSAINPFSNGGQVNPYAGPKNPYSLRNTGGWNI